SLAANSPAVNELTLLCQKAGGDCTGSGNLSLTSGLCARGGLARARSSDRSTPDHGSRRNRAHRFRAPAATYWDTARSRFGRRVATECPFGATRLARPASPDDLPDSASCWRPDWRLPLSLDPASLKTR